MMLLFTAALAIGGLILYFWPPVADVIAVAERAG
jgi:hypothetical protein